MLRMRLFWWWALLGLLAGQAAIHHPAHGQISPGVGWDSKAQVFTPPLPPPPPPGGCGTTPTEASNAGFTTCAINYDYSTAAGAPSMLIDCSGSNKSLPFVTGGPGIAGNSGRCAAGFTQTTDPVTGQTVLKVQWLKSYGGGVSNWVVAYTWHDTSHYVDFPNFYIEEVFRIDASSNNTDNMYTGAVDLPYIAGNKFGTGPNPLQTEFDVPELSAVASSGIATQGLAHGIQWVSGPTYYTTWVANNPGYHTPAGWNANAYATYGFMLTSNGTNPAYICSWVNHIFQACAAQPLTAGQFTERNVLVLVAGDPISQVSSTNVTAYVQYTRVWTCAAGVIPAGTAPTPGTMCNFTTLHGPSTPGNSTPTYYGP